MSSLSSTNQATKTSPTEPFPTITVTKPARPVSAPCPNFSKPIITDPPTSTNSNRKSVDAQEVQARIRAHRKSVGAHEVQARIQAARRSLTAAQPPTEAFQRKLEQNPDLIHPALRARSGVTSNSERSRSHKSRIHQDQSIDAVIRRLSAEINGEHPKHPADVPPVPALPTLTSSGMGRPRSYQPGSSRSSVTKRRSPLSIVSSPDDYDESEETSAQTSRHTSRRASTSASSQTSKSSTNDLDDDASNEKIRVVSIAAHESGHIQHQHEPTPQPSPCLSPTISRPKSQPVKHRSPWPTLTRRRILCFV
ncbi:uncharacterized protein yc1106_04744 [Curvularia clavata]|uniref:Uncharacterized protein n=1 Tax=Curvularia clavata TaxID=95742 RepID=A0A9Q9DSZ1_CURCL|nr:uncharacterized protein yc1106_04744 [Curvularia clavata]